MLDGKCGRVVGFVKIISLCLCCLLVLSMMAQAGVVKAETEVIEEHGGLEVELRPEFSDATYLVDENVLHIERFHDAENVDIGAGEIDDGKYYHGTPGSTNNPAEITTTDGTINSGGQTFDEITIGWKSLMESSESSTSRVLGYITDTSELWVEYSEGTYPPQLNVDGTVETFSFPSSYDTNVAYRYTLTINEGGDIEFVTYDRTNEEIDTMYIENSVVSSATGENILVGGEYAWQGYTDYIFVTEGSAPTNRMYTPTIGDFQVSDSWKPNYDDDTSTNIDYDEMVYVGESGDGVVEDISYIGELDNTTNIDSFSGRHSIHYLAQTPEVYDERFTSDSYFQGWNNLDSEIVGNLMRFGARLTDSSPQDVTVVDYYIDDLVLEAQYSEDKREEIREAYADAFLAVAEENEWVIQFASLADEEDDGWRRPHEYEDGGWFTVEELLVRDDFDVVEIQGNKRYGNPEDLRIWKESFNHVEFSLNGNRESGEFDPVMFLGDGSTERGTMKEDIIDGQFNVDTNDTVSDMTDVYRDITSRMKEMSVSHFSIYEGTVADVANYWNSIVGAGYYDSDRYVVETKHFQSTNLALSSVLHQQTENHTYSLANQSHQLDEHYRMRYSLSEMQDSYEIDYGERVEAVFSFMALDEDRETYGIANRVPLSVGSSTASTLISTTVIIIIIVGVMVVGTLIWARNKNLDEGRKNTTNRN